MAAQGEEDRGQTFCTLSNDLATDSFGTVAKASEAGEAGRQRMRGVFRKATAVIRDLEGVLSENHPARE